MHTHHQHRHQAGVKHVVDRVRARRETLHKVSRLVEVLAVLSIARRIGWKRGRKLAALASMALLQERHADARGGRRR